eukprot:3764838-Rhodomonas_salina.2
MIGYVRTTHHIGYSRTVEFLCQYQPLRIKRVSSLYLTCPSRSNRLDGRPGAVNPTQQGISFWMLGEMQAMIPVKFIEGSPVLSRWGGGGAGVRRRAAQAVQPSAAYLSTRIAETWLDHAFQIISAHTSTGAWRVRRGKRRTGRGEGAGAYLRERERNVEDHTAKASCLLCFVVSPDRSARTSGFRVWAWGLVFRV